MRVFLKRCSLVIDGRVGTALTQLENTLSLPSVVFGGLHHQLRLQLDIPKTELATVSFWLHVGFAF